MEKELDTSVFSWTIGRAALVFIFLIFSITAQFGQSNNDDFMVNSITHWNQNHPSICPRLQGGFIITWANEVEWDEAAGMELTEIFVRIFDENGTPSGPEFMVNSNWEHFQERPKIASGKDGQFVVVWTNYKENEIPPSISARVFSQNGIPQGPEFQVNQYSNDYQGEPDIAINGDGNFIITWQSWGQDGDELGVFARLFAGDGTPSGSEFQVNTHTLDDQFHPSIAIDQDGDFYIVWTSFHQDGDQTGIFVQRFEANGNRIGAEFQLNDTTLGWQEWPDIAVDQSGNVIVCWHSFEYGENSYEIIAKSFEKNLSFIGDEFKVNDNSENWQVFPSIDVDSEGNFLIVWQSLDQDGESFGIFAQMFDKYGNRLDSEFQVNRRSLGTQEAPDVILLDRDSFIITWEDYLSAESEWDIYARIFTGQSNTFIVSTAREQGRKTAIIKK